MKLFSPEALKLTENVSLKMKLFSPEALQLTKKPTKSRGKKKQKAKIVVSYGTFACDGEGFKEGDRYVSVHFDGVNEGFACPCKTEQEADEEIKRLFEKYKDTYDFELIDETESNIFESEWIKQLKESGEYEYDDDGKPFFEYKEKVSVSRAKKQEKDGSRLQFIVTEFFEYNHQDENFSDFSELPFDSRENATLFFNEKADELKSLKEQADKNILFDGRRYFWKLDENNNVLGRA